MNRPALLRSAELWTEEQHAAARWCADFYARRVGALWAGAPDPDQPGHTEALEVIRQTEVFASLMQASDTVLDENGLTTCAALLLIGEQLSAEAGDDGSTDLTPRAPVAQTRPEGNWGEAPPDETVLRAARLACLAQLEPDRAAAVNPSPHSVRVLRQVTRGFLARLEPANAQDRPLWRKIRKLLWALDAPRVVLDMDHARDALVLLTDVHQQHHLSSVSREALRVAAAECAPAAWGAAPHPLLDAPPAVTLKA